MTNEPTNQNIDKVIVDFVNNAYPDFTDRLSLFRKIANDITVPDEHKLNQLTIHIMDIAKQMSLSFTDKVDNETKLVYDIAITLANDDRILRLTNIAQAIWEQLPGVQEFTDIVMFNTILISRDSMQKLDAALNGKSGYCC